MTLIGAVRAARRPFDYPGLGRWLSVCLIFCVLALVQTWPLVLHATDRIIMTSALVRIDTLVFIWNLWWVDHALTDLHTNPYHTELLYYPEGTDLYLHTMATVNGVVLIPLRLITGNPILSWNILAILYFTLSGVCMYALCYRITQNHMAALISGYIFAFSPIVLMHFTTGHWHISTIWPIPLLALFLVRFLDTHHWGNAAGAGVCWAVLTYNNLEYAVDAAVFLAIFALYWSVVYIRNHDLPLRRLWLGMASVGAVWLVLVVPLLVPTIVRATSGRYVTPANDEYHSANLVSFVTPSPLWGPGTDPVGDTATVQAPIGNSENTAFLGISVLLLAAASLLSIRRSPHLVAFWLLVFLSFAVLALGPYLHVGDAKLSLPLPYQILEDLPLMGTRRAPTRMIIFGSCALAILAGIGFKALSTMIQPKYGRLLPLFSLLIFSLIVLEYWNPPIKTTTLASPAALHEIRREQGDFAVFTVGSGWNGQTNYYQTIHERPIFGGYLSRVDNRQISSAFGELTQEPGIHYLSCLCPDYNPLPPPEAQKTFYDWDLERVNTVLRRYKIRYILYHKVDPYGFPVTNSKMNEVVDNYLRNFLSLTVVSDDSSIAVYRNEGVPSKGID